MEIGMNASYPSGFLSNFTPYEFEFRGIKCASMEGLLQSFKFKNPEKQIEICRLIGVKAKQKGKKEAWDEEQTLYWQGKPIKRDSQEYQDMLDEAYDSLAENGEFRRALLFTNDDILTHSIGRNNPCETILTQSEFCDRLMKIREKIKNGEC